VWNGLVRSPGDFLTSRFFLGWLIGIQLATAPIYTSEVLNSPRFLHRCGGPSRPYLNISFTDCNDGRSWIYHRNFSINYHWW
jgi:hypothetical protein